MSAVTRYEGVNLRIFDYLTEGEKCAASRVCKAYNIAAKESLLKVAVNQFQQIGLFEGFNGQKLFQELPTIRYIRARLGQFSSPFSSHIGIMPKIAFTHLRKDKPGSLLLIHNFSVENLISSQPALLAFVNTRDMRYKTFEDSDEFYHSIYKNKCVILTPNTYSSFSSFVDEDSVLGFRLAHKFSPIHVDYFRRLILNLPCGQLETFDGREEVRTVEKRNIFCCRRKVSVVALEKPLKIEKTKTE